MLGLNVLLMRMCFQSTEGLPESRRLELNAYLTKPTTRLARYPLLLEAVLKHTPDDSPDKHVLPQVVKMVREFLTKVNTESGKAENRASLQKLNDALFFKQGEEVVCVIRLCSFRKAASMSCHRIYAYWRKAARWFTRASSANEMESFRFSCLITLCCSQN